MARILHDTGADTVIEDRPWLLGFVLVGACTFSAALLFQAWADGNVALGLAALVLGGGSYAAFRAGIRATRLTLFADGSALLTVRSHAGITHRRIAPGTLRAGVETRHGGSGATQRAMLLIDGPGGVERLPLTVYYSSSRRHARAVERIEAWRRATS